MIQFMDWWQADHSAFEGVGALRDAARHNEPVASRQAVARLFVIHALAGAVGYGHDFAVDGLTAASYLAALFAADDPEAIALSRCLAACQGAWPRTASITLANELHDAARICAARSAPDTARSLAELAYEAALEIGSWQDAYFAARILERLAVLDECPPAAERWGHRAELHLRRVRRALGHV